MAEIIKFSFTCNELIALADKALEEHDVARHVDHLKRALALDPSCTEASMRLAQTYASIGAYDASNDVIFKALSFGVEEEDRALFFTQLAMNYFDMDMPDVAEYYLRDYADDFDISYPERDDEKNDLHLVWPRGEDYYERLIEQAYDLIKQQRLDDAMALMDEVPSNSKAKDAANHVVLICLMLRNDLDSVIANAQRMLAENGDSLVVKCTLATAYMMEERTDEARAIVEEAVGKDISRFEDILLLLPLLVNLEMHGEIVKYCRRVLSEHEWQMNTMIWLSIALYNMGEREEAKRVMRQVNTVFGEHSPAKYYLDLFDSAPENVEYSMSLPQKERIKRLHSTDEILRMPMKKLSELFASDTQEGEELRALVEWAMTDGGDKLQSVLVRKLSLMDEKCVDKLFRRLLLKPDLSFDVTTTMFDAIFELSGSFVNVSLVAQDRYKEIKFYKPKLFDVAPEPLYGAMRLALSEIVFTDEEPMYYIDRLMDILRGLVIVGSNEEVLMTSRLQKICKLKSLRTVVGTLLGKVYEEDESREDIIQRYELVPRTYDKYCKIFFGDGNE